MLPLHCFGLFCILFDSIKNEIIFPYVQEHRAKMRGPANQTEINLGEFRKGQENLDIFRAD